MSSLESLEAKLESLDADSELNLGSKKRDLAMAVVEVAGRTGLWRKVVKYADIAIAGDPTWVPAHVAKVEALVSLAAVNAKMLKRARIAVDAGLRACDKVVAMENLADTRRHLTDLKQQLAAP